MKKVLYLVMKNAPSALSTLEELKEKGFNATVINTESLNHAIDYEPRDHHFFSLRQLERADFMESVLCLFVLEEDRLAIAKSIIREKTNHFQDIRGFMFALPLEDYEGSV